MGCECRGGKGGRGGLTDWREFDLSFVLYIQDMPFVFVSIRAAYLGGKDRDAMRKNKEAYR